MRSPVGAITYKVRIIARPVSTCVGGTCAAPIALRRIDSTTDTRTKQVSISSANGINDSAAMANTSTSGRDDAASALPAASAAAGASVTAAKASAARLTVAALREAGAARGRAD